MCNVPKMNTKTLKKKPKVFYFSSSMNTSFVLDPGRFIRSDVTTSRFYFIFAGIRARLKQ